MMRDPWHHVSFPGQVLLEKSSSSAQARKISADSQSQIRVKSSYVDGSASFSAAHPSRRHHYNLDPTRSSQPLEIAILTPYTHQKDLLKLAIPKYNVSSIDGYQGREADVIIFVTVRSNLHCETGFLKDMRRLNVAMTRAKAGVIIIGDRATLTGMGSDNGDTESRRVWKNLLDWCTEIKLQS
jgi:hypothetical protein